MSRRRLNIRTPFLDRLSFRRWSASACAGPGSIPPAFAGVAKPRRSRSREAGLSPPGDDPSRKKIMNPSPGAVGPASPRPLHSSSERRGRYADAPAAALLTGLGAGEWPPLRCGPCAVIFFEFLRGAAPRARKGARAAPAGGRVSPVFRASLVQTRSFLAALSGG
jgi:hypothetical protein